MTSEELAWNLVLAFAFATAAFFEEWRMTKAKLLKLQDELAAQRAKLAKHIADQPRER